MEPRVSQSIWRMFALHCRGLSPPRVKLQTGPDPLWTVKPEREGGPAAAAKAPAAAQLTALPLYKEKPEGEQVGCKR